jgi:hypothetical protein
LGISFGAWQQMLDPILHRVQLTKTIVQDLDEVEHFVTIVECILERVSFKLLDLGWMDQHIDEPLDDILDTLFNHIENIFVELGLG